jgi:hypothetical protein
LDEFSPVDTAKPDFADFNKEDLEGETSAELF